MSYAEFQRLSDPTLWTADELKARLTSEISIALGDMFEIGCLVADGCAETLMEELWPMIEPIHRELEIRKEAQ